MAFYHSPLNFAGFVTIRPRVSLISSTALDVQCLYPTLYIQCILDFQVRRWIWEVIPSPPLQSGPCGTAWSHG